ncbi:MAG: dienelactone hydrolase [Leptolyngbya foveolarum]|uniref:Dienelactone hydrolase n=1 Tax=Leptolyngbya foveolarum TaxID=47253 RepID=A0A2W4U212_9CYAN|nr:MAG: dienelactone hydrolase [Leptolyngbya foveolarum]
MGLGAGLVALAAAPSLASDRIVLKVGPLRQSIELRDLESFARTGEVPDSLRLYSGFLSPEVQKSLYQKLDLDPRMSDRIIADVLDSANGELLLDALTQIAPNMTLDQLQGAIRLAAMQANGLNVISVLRAIPQETLEVDLTAAIGLISQLNFSTLESRSLSGVLDQELNVALAVPPQSDLDPTAAGLQQTYQRSMTMFDEDRQRTIPVEMYWSRNPQGPLVVLSHGFGADRFFLKYMAEHLSSHGITVVSLEHPGSNLKALQGLPVDPDIIKSPSRLLPASEFLDRPRDVSFVLDRLENLNQQADFQGLFNTEDVTIIGHSLGGYTGLALAGAKLDLRSLQTFCDTIQPLAVSPADWLQCAAVDLPEQQADLSDDRIKQVMAMNPLVGQLFGEAGLSEVKVPTLMMTATKDGVTPTLDQQLKPFTQLAGPKYLLAVIGGTHLSSGDPGNVNPALTQLPFMAELDVQQTSELRRLLRGLSLSFVEQRMPEADTYKPFLSAGYVQSFSTPALPLRFAETLPSSLDSWLGLTSKLSNERSPDTADRLVSLGYLQTIENKAEWQKSMAVHLRAKSVVTVLRSPLPLVIGR